MDIELLGEIMSVQDSDRKSSMEMVASVVSAYVSNNHVSADNLPGLIQSIKDAFDSASMPTPELTTEPAQPLVPAVPVKKSITPDYIVCLEDGKQFKSLKRHLNTHYNLTPEAYRQKWNLPADYPMVAANYAARRSELAKHIGLGHNNRKSGPQVSPPTKPPAEAAPPKTSARRERKKASEKAAEVTA